MSITNDFKYILDQSNDIICTLDASGKIIWLNHAVHTLLGYEPSSLVGKPYTDLVWGEDREKTVKAAEEIKSGIQITDFKNRYVDSRGRIIPIFWSATWNESEKLMYCIGRDATEKKQNEEIIRESEEKYRKMFNSNPLPMWIYELHTLKFLDVNDTAIEFYGYSREEFMGMTLMDIRPESDISLLIKAHKGVENIDGQIRFGVFTHRRKDGSLLRMEVSGHSINYAQKLCILVVCNDITEKEQAELKRTDYESKLRKATEIAQLGYWQFSPDKLDLYWSDEVYRIWGVSQDTFDLSYNQFLSTIHEGDKEDFKSNQESWLSVEKEHDYVYRIVLPDGGIKWIRQIGRLEIDELNQTLVLKGTVQDISLQKNKDIQKRLLGEISQILNKEIKIGPAMNGVLTHLAQFGDFSFAEAWLVNTDRSGLHLFATFPGKVDNKSFIPHNPSTKTLGLGEGLPGTVWLSKKADLWKGIENSNPSVRYTTASPIGAHDVLGIPLLQNDEVVGVLVFGSTGKNSRLNYSKQIFRGLESYLGAEMKRKQLEEDLNQIFTTSPDVICIAGTDGYLKRINPAACILLGYSEAELLIKPLMDLVHPEDRKNLLVIERQLFHGQPTQQFENRVLKKSGEFIWLAWTIAPSSEEGWIFGIAKNITKQKNIQNLLDSASELARIGGWEVDLINNSVFWSPITREIHEAEEGFNPDLEAAINFYREDVRPQVRQHIEKCISSGHEWDFELPIITAKGNELWVRSIGQCEFREGIIVRVFGSFQDIHKRKIAELRLQNTANNIPGAIFQYLLHPSGQEKILYLTKGALDLWGHSPEACMENIEIMWNQCEQAGDLSLLKNSLKRSADTMERWHCEYRSRLPSGQILWHEGFGSPQKLPDGSILWDALIIDITEKKNFESLLDRSSTMARIGSWELNFKQQHGNGDNMYWSPMTRAILEVDEDYNPSLTKGFEFYEDKSKEAIKDAVNRLIEESKDFDLELLITTTKGNQKWVRCIGQSDVVDGNCIKIFGSFQDIHQRKIAELALQKAHDDKIIILESIGDAFFAVDNHWTVTYWNKLAETNLGKKREEVLGKNLWAMYEDAVHLDFYKQYHKAMDSGEIVNFEEYYPTLQKWFEVSAYPSVNGLSVYFKNVSYRKLAEIKLRQSNERFEKVAQATNDAIWDWDIQNNTLSWGNGYKTMFGYEVEKITPTLDTWVSYIHPDDQEKVMDSLQHILGGPDSSTWHHEYRFLKANGEFAYVMDRGVIMKDEYNEPIRMIGAMTDMTERKNFEVSLKNLNATLDVRAKELAMSNAELEQFAYVASHDLQEPLRMITSFLAQLEKHYKDRLDDKARKYIHFAVDGAKRMRQIILDLLDFSRVGKLDTEKELLDMKELVKEACLLQRKTIEEKSAQIITHDLPVIHNFKAPLLQVFLNLINNAVKYSKDQVAPNIEILAEESPKYWTFTVKDNGIGISPAYYDKIFIIFQRLHAKEEFSGTGMGLAIVKKIVENLGGKIWVNSVEGEGTAFYFTLIK